jgi:hypothetical protein
VFTEFFSILSHFPGSVAFIPGLVAPGLVAPGLVAPGLVAPGLVAPGLVAPGLVAPGLVAPALVGVPKKQLMPIHKMAPSTPILTSLDVR